MLSYRGIHYIINASVNLDLEFKQSLLSASCYLNIIISYYLNIIISYYLNIFISYYLNIILSYYLNTCASYQRHIECDLLANGDSDKGLIFTPFLIRLGFCANYWRLNTEHEVFRYVAHCIHAIDGNIVVSEG